MMGVSASFYYSCMCVWYVWYMCLTCWHMWLGRHMLVCAQAFGSQRMPLSDFLLLPSLSLGKVFQTQSSAIQLVQLARLPWGVLCLQLLRTGVVGRHHTHPALS